jgi:predicted HTH transcriptional regulator
MKTVAGFLNACGGLLFIGVRDETHEIVGLESDFELLKSKIQREIDPEDQFEQHFDKLRVKLCLNEKFWPLVVPELRKIEGKTVYVVQVQQADEYVFLEKKDVFYIREKKETMPISPRKIRGHWERRNLYCNE